jgi:hypothetical protein
MVLLLAGAEASTSPPPPPPALDQPARDQPSLGPPPLDQLMGLLAQRTHGIAEFRQQQFLSVLKQPLDSSGLLLYDAPDRLEQRTLLPHPQSLVVDHGLVTLQLGAHQRTLRLADYPQLVPLIESVRATLAGDRATLERLFRLDFNGALEHWDLLLVPRDPALAAQVKRIRLSGAAAAITEIEVLQAGGDHSLMRITPRE